MFNSNFISRTSRLPKSCVPIFYIAVKIPWSEEDWREIANGFRLKWNFSLCVGAIEWMHVQIETPENNGVYIITGAAIGSVVSVSDRWAQVHQLET